MTQPDHVVVCPVCTNSMRRVPSTCSRPGCLVAHYKYVCYACLRRQESSLAVLHEAFGTIVDWPE